MQFIYINKVIEITSAWSEQKITKRDWINILKSSSLSKVLLKSEVSGIRNVSLTCILLEPELWLRVYYIYEQQKIPISRI